MKILADPVACLWFLVLGDAAYCFARNRRRLASAFLFVALVTWVMEIARGPARLLAGLERPYLSQNASSVDPADAVEVLGFIREVRVWTDGGYRV